MFGVAFRARMMFPFLIVVALFNLQEPPAAGFGQLLPYLGLLAGVLARILIPFAIEKLNDDSIEWDWRMVLPQLLTGIMAFFTLVAANPDLGGWAWQAALALGLALTAAGWGSADIGRKIAKSGN